MKIVMYLVIEALAIVIAWHACDFVLFRFRIWNDRRRLHNAMRNLNKVMEAAARENETAHVPETEIKPGDKAKIHGEVMVCVSSSEFPTPSPTPEADPFQKKPRKPRAMTAKIKRKSKSRK